MSMWGYCGDAEEKNVVGQAWAVDEERTHLICDPRKIILKVNNLRAVSKKCYDVEREWA